jgi:hypothetical protein
MATSLILALRCPISGEIMHDPVILVCSGLSYERSSIEEWIRVNGTDPESGAPLRDTRLIRNPCLRALIESVVAAV